MARLLARTVLAAFVAYLVLALAVAGLHARATTWTSTLLASGLTLKWGDARGPRHFGVRLTRDGLRDLGRG
jgi:hypothetical protein